MATLSNLCGGGHLETRSKLTLIPITILHDRKGTPKTRHTVFVISKIDFLALSGYVDFCPAVRNTFIADKTAFNTFPASRFTLVTPTLQMTRRSLS